MSQAPYMPEAPAPFVSSDIDVRDLDGFMLNVERLLASELVAIGSAEECWHAFMLWCRAWKQLPAGSLPNDERVLASFSGAGKRWSKVREVALHGWVLCSDGRLYHRFVAGEVMRAWQRKLAYRTRREADRERLSEWRKKQKRNGSETASETAFVAEDTGQGQGHIQEQDNDESSLRSDSSAADAARPIAEGMLAIWKEECAGALSIPSKLTPERIRACAARWKDMFERSADCWRTHCRAIMASDFLRGEGGGWRADFDFALSKTKILWVREGKYGGSSQAKGTNGRNGPAPYEHATAGPKGPPPKPEELWPDLRGREDWQSTMPQ